MIPLIRFLLKWFVGLVIMGWLLLLIVIMSAMFWDGKFMDFGQQIMDYFVEKC